MATSKGTLESLIAEINSKGWRVSTLNQISNGAWMSAVQKPGYYSSGFGQDFDPYKALESAWVGRKEPLEDRMPVMPVTIPDKPETKPERVRLKRRV